MSVKILKMLSGEEVLAKQTDKGTYEKVRVFQITQGGAGLVPWIVLNPDAEITISDSAIVAKTDAPTDVEKQYLQATSGIQLMS